MKSWINQSLSIEDFISERFPDVVHHSETAVSITNAGSSRKTNDDVSWVGENQFSQKIVIVCDGLGGYEGGFLASQIVCKVFVQGFVNFDFRKKSVRQIKKWFEENLNRSRIVINLLICEFNQYEKMSTTLSMGIMVGNKLYVFNIGDSRVYTLRNNKLEQISVDQNYYNFLKSKNKFDLIKTTDTQQLFSITSFIGKFDEIVVDYDFFEVDNFRTGYFLATTDGLHNFIDQEKIVMVLNQKESLKIKTELLVNEALKNGSNDNISISIFSV